MRLFVNNRSNRRMIGTVALVGILLLTLSVSSVFLPAIVDASASIVVSDGSLQMQINNQGQMSLYLDDGMTLTPLIAYEEFLLRATNWDITQLSSPEIVKEGRDSVKVSYRLAGAPVLTKRYTVSPQEIAIEVNINLPSGLSPESKRIFHQLRLPDNLIAGAPYVAVSNGGTITGNTELSGARRAAFINALAEIAFITQLGKLTFTFEGKNDWQLDDLSDGTIGKPYFRLTKNELRNSDEPLAEKYIIRIKLLAGTEREKGEAGGIRIDGDKLLGGIDPKVFGINIHAFYWGKLHQWQLPEQERVIAYLKAAGIGAVRYPGGNRTDFWHWQKPLEGGQYHSIEVAGGLAPADPTEPYATDDPDNVTDTDEFVQFAQITGTVPYIIANFTTGTAREAADWVRYTNVEHDYNIRYWEVGGEEFFFGDPGGYSSRFRQYQTEMKKVDPSILVGVNIAMLPADSQTLRSRFNEWLPTVLSECGDIIDFFNLHYYPSPSDSYEQILMNVLTLRTQIETVKQMVIDITGRRDIRIVVAEWGWRHPSLARGLFSAIALGELLKSGVELACYYDYDTWSDWSFFSPTYSGEHQWDPHDPQTNPFPRPTYWAFYLWHKMKGTLVETSENSAYAHLAVYSAKDEKTLRVLVVNKSDKEIAAPIEIKGISPGGEVQTWVLQGQADASGLETVECTLNGQPASLEVRPEIVPVSSASFRQVFPQYSITLLEIAVQEDRQ